MRPGEHITSTGEQSYSPFIQVVPISSSDWTASSQGCVTISPDLSIFKNFFSFSFATCVIVDHTKFGVKLKIPSNPV
jgi:hypothetical protein